MEKGKLTENHEINPFFFEEILEAGSPVRLRGGTSALEPVTVRRSRLYPGHISLIARHRTLRDVPEEVKGVLKEDIDSSSCKFCRPGDLCAESDEEQTKLSVEDTQVYVTRTPYYSVPGHLILFDPKGPHRLEASTEKDWRVLLSAGVTTAGREQGLRLGLNAGAYIVCGSSQRHLHVQLLPFDRPTPAEQALEASLPDGASYDEILGAFDEKGLIVEKEEGAFLAACWAPKFSLEMVAVFSRPASFAMLGPSDTNLLARWLHGASIRFAAPAGGGINGFGLETPGLPYLVRIIPRLPGAVLAFLEAGADLMVISQPPESVAALWRDKV